MPFFRIGRALGLAAALAATAHCSDRDASSPPPTTPIADAAADAPVTDVQQSVVVPIEVRSYRLTGGKFFRANVSINGSAPIPVLLDTGSTGLRVFASTLSAVTALDTGKAASIEFAGNVLDGKEIRARVALGSATTPEAIAIQRIDQAKCAPGAVGCDPANVEKQYTDEGIVGILGVGLRPDPSGIVSPLAQLESALARGYVLRTSGFDSSSAELVLGATLDADFAAIALTRAGALPNGVPAWADDAISICYSLDGAPVDPPCSDSVFDTGSNMDVLYAKNAAAKTTKDGLLAAGVTFGAKHEGALDLSLRVGDPPTAGKDAVLVQSDDPFTILGLAVFFRYDVAFDVANGRVGLRRR